MLAAHVVSTQEDVPMHRTYLRLIGDGVELVFQDKRLTTVFLYLTKGPENCGIFSGSTDTLDRQVLDKADEREFSDVLEAKGYEPSKRTYPFSVDWLNDVIRIRLEKRSSDCLVMIDDGSIIR
ncbi:hypothetical protein RCCS2_10470 [Roseobacter sp. CCS2]|nr:hypothetical protein RCCS2_10470 [Roseobacter sp. CCS2]